MAFSDGSICNFSELTACGPARAREVAEEDRTNQMPFAMQLHLDEIARHVAKGAHAVLLLDRAGWHTTARLNIPKNITPIFLPSRAPTLFVTSGGIG